MCKAIDDLIHDGEMRGLERGREEGLQQGESRVFSLITKLLEDGKQNLLSSIANDEKLRAELYLKYQL